MENKDFMTQWKKGSMRIGAPTNLLAALTSFIPVIWLCSSYVFWPDPAGVLSVWVLVVVSFDAAYII